MAAWALDNPRRFRRVTWAPAVVLGLALFGGCAVNGGPPDSPRTQAAAGSNPLLLVPGPSAPPVDADMPRRAVQAPVSATPTPTPTVAAREDARRLAGLFVSGFGRPTVAAEVWQADLAPMVTRDYAEALSVVDPASLPPEVVTGPAEENEVVSTPEAAVWHVPTDAGGVQVTTVLVDGQWKVDSAIPVDDHS